MKYDAELKNWSYAFGVLYGEIHNDSKGRFPDGTKVKTSTVENIIDGIAKTRNTKYKLEAF